MKARKEISTKVSLKDVAQQLVGEGDGNTLVALLNEVATVVQRNYAQQHDDYRIRIGVFLDRTDYRIDGNAVALLRAMIERAEKKMISDRPTGDIDYRALRRAIRET